MSTELDRAWEVFWDLDTDEPSSEESCTGLATVIGHIMLAVGALEQFQAKQRVLLDSLSGTPITGKSVAGGQLRPMTDPFKVAEDFKIPGFDPNSKRQVLGLKLASAQLDLAHQLGARRRALGMTLPDVAAAMKESESYVAFMEDGGANPSLSQIRRYAKAVDAMVTYTVTPEGRRDETEGGK